MKILSIVFLLMLGTILSAAPATPGPAESPAWATKDLRVGIIGTDTSHVPVFTGIFAKNPQWRIKVVAAFKGGSPDIPASANRIEEYAKTIHEKFGVEIVDSIETLLTKVDVVLLESVDGRPHLAQATPVLKAGKPIFIDKPLAASLADAREIVRLSKETGTPFFTASSYRFHPDIQKLREKAANATKVQGSGPYNTMAFHPDLFYYGIHGVEALYAVMGPGCEKVTRKSDEHADITTGTWKGGRIGIFHGVKKGEKPPMVRVWSKDGTVSETAGASSYDPMLKAIAEFFHTGKPPVDAAESIEVFEFMMAAQRSSETGGAEVKLSELRK